MKNLLVSRFLIALSLLTIACHKTDGVIPQEPFVGAYTVAGKQELIAASGKTTAVIDVSDQVTVSVTATANRIKVSSVSHPALEAILINKNSFTIPEQRFLNPSVSGYTKIYSGSGVVTGNQLLLSLDVSLYSDQLSTATRTLTHVEGTRQ